MSNQVYIKIGSSNIRIVCNEVSFWQTWKWKLDSYTVKRLEQPLDLSISLSQMKKKAEGQILLSENIAGFFCHRVYGTENGDYLWQYERNKNGEVILSYLMSHKMNQITLLKDNSNTAGSLAFEYLGFFLPVLMLGKEDALSFHGVLMEHSGKGIILSAPSGTGKTTHARMWRELYHALIINGDRSTCGKRNGIWTGFGVPWSGTSGEQINRSVPITAMVVLEQSEENRADVLKGMEAFAAVLPNLQYPGWDAKLTNKAMELVDDFLSEIPVIRLYCRPDEEAVRILKTTLENL